MRALAAALRIERKLAMERRRPILGLDSWGVELPEEKLSNSRRDRTMMTDVHARLWRSGKRLEVLSRSDEQYMKPNRGREREMQK